MQDIFAVTVPFFALVLLGWLAARGHALPESAIPGLNAYVLFFALPCMLFRFGSSLPLARLADPALLGIYLVAALAVVAATVALTWRGRRGRDGVDLRDAAFGALVGAFPNAGFMGVPLLVALLGDAAAGPVIGAIVVDLVVTSTLCLAIAQIQVGRSVGSNERSAARGALLALRGALTNPLPWAIVVGAGFALARRELPGPIAQIVRMLGDSATPVALFTIGAVLWRAGLHAHSRTPVARYLPVALIKLRRPSGARLRARPRGATARRRGVALRADGADADRRPAEREQRVAAGRALRRRQRPRRPHHPGLDGDRLRDLLRLRRACSASARPPSGRTVILVFCIQSTETVASIPSTA